jgi:hypothetical protein
VSSLHLLYLDFDRVGARHGRFRRQSSGRYCWEGKAVASEAIWRDEMAVVVERED